MQDSQGFSSKEESGLAGGGAEASQVSQEALWRQDVSGPCPGNKHNKSTPTLRNSHQFNRKTEQSPVQLQQDLTVTSSYVTWLNSHQFDCNMTKQHQFNWNTTEQSPIQL